MISEKFSTNTESFNEFRRDRRIDVVTSSGMTHCEIRVHSENLVLEHSPEFSTSHAGPLIVMITYHKNPATTIYRYWSKCSNWYVGIDHEYR